MRANIDARSKAFYLLYPLLLAALFPIVQLLTSIVLSLLTGSAFGEETAHEITATAEYLLAVTSISQLLALAVIMWHSRAIRRQPAAASRRLLDRRTIRSAVLVSGPVIVLTVGAQIVEGSILSLFNVPLGRYAEIAELILQAHIAIVIVTVAIIPGICEEIIFRGIIQPVTVRGSGPVSGIVYTAAMFGIVHLVPVQIFAGFFFGIVFGYVCYRAGSVLPAIISHIAANAIVALVGRVGSDSGTSTEVLAGDAASTGMLLTALGIGALVAAAGVVWFEKTVREGRW